MLEAEWSQHSPTEQQLGEIMGVLCRELYQTCGAESEQGRLGRDVKSRTVGRKGSFKRRVELKPIYVLHPDTVVVEVGVNTPLRGHIPINCSRLGILSKTSAHSYRVGARAGVESSN